MEKVDADKLEQQFGHLNLTRSHGSQLFQFEQKPTKNLQNSNCRSITISELDKNKSLKLHESWRRWLFKHQVIFQIDLIVPEFYLRFIAFSKQKNQTTCKDQIAGKRCRESTWRSVEVDSSRALCVSRIGSQKIQVLLITIRIDGRNSLVARLQQILKLDKLDQNCIECLQDQKLFLIQPRKLLAKI